MSEVPAVAPIPAPRRTKLRHVPLLLGIVVLLGGAGAAWWYFTRSTPPEPPMVARDGVDPELVEAIEAARRKVSAAPRSGSAWGELGMVLRAHGYEAEAEQCFAQAQQWEPKQAQWV